MTIGSGPAVPAATDLAGAILAYRDLHTHPELSGQEERTAARLAASLTEAGAAVSTGIGGHGLVGVLANGAGPTVALRAELDALAVREETGLPYAADGPVMHACGHDLHLAALTATARTLTRCRESWRGTVLLIGQPAEETLTGAAAMVADGLYDRFGRPDVVLAQHAAALPAGMVAHAPPVPGQSVDSPILAGSVTLRIAFTGAGGHAGAPHASVDPLLAASATVVALQAVVARQVAPAEAAVLHVGRIEAGTGPNTLADRAVLDVTARSTSTTTLERLVAATTRIARAEFAAAGGDGHPDVTVVSRSAVTDSDSATSDLVRRAHERYFGVSRMAWMPPSLSTEDIRDLCPDGIPLGYWMVGVIGPTEWNNATGSSLAEKINALPGNHSSRFAPDAKRSMSTAVTALTSAALAHLGEA